MTPLLAVSVQAADWSWNGYLGVNYIGDTTHDPQSHASFVSQVFALRPSVRIDDNIRVVGEVDFEHSPQIEALNGPGGAALNSNSSGELDVSAAYGEFAPTDFLKIRAGKFFSPIGFYNSLFYAVPTFPTIQTPQASVYGHGDTMQRDALFFQRHATGLWVSGDREVAGLRPSLDLFLTNGKSFERSADDNDHKAFGGRLKVPFSVSDEAKITPILSFYDDKFIQSSSTVTPNQNSLRQLTVVPGVEAEVGNLTVRGELASTDLASRDALPGGTKDHMTAYYGEAFYTLAERATPYMRFESLSSKYNHFLAGAAPDFERQSELTYGLAYHLRLWEALVKLELRNHWDSNATAPGRRYYNVYAAGLAIGF